MKIKEPHKIRVNASLGKQKYLLEGRVILATCSEIRIMENKTWVPTNSELNKGIRSMSKDNENGRYVVKIRIPVFSSMK